MSDLTKEYFDEVLKGLATKKDLEGLATKKILDERMDGVHARIDLLDRELKTEMQEIKARVESISARDLQDTGALGKDILDHNKRINAIEQQLNINSQT